MSDPVTISGSIVNMSVDTRTDPDFPRRGISTLTMTFTIAVDPACFNDAAVVQNMRERLNVGSSIDIII